jgi:hypothetical protein
MAQFSLNLPIDVPWRLIATSPDMMDTSFCNKHFPFAWRSSLAISAFEPDLTDTAAELCGQRLTYLKITTTVTGYQPSKAETDQGYVSFPDVPTEELTRILSEYFGCYGVLVNVAVFPYPDKIRETVRICIDFADQAPGDELSNPYETEGVSFEATGAANNRIVEGHGDHEVNPSLDLVREMRVTVPPCSRIRAKTVHHNPGGVSLAAYRGDDHVGTADAGAVQGRVHTLEITHPGIDRVIFTAPQDEAALLELCLWVERERPVTLTDYPHIMEFEPKVRDLYQAATDIGEVLTASKSGVMTDKTLTHTESTQTGLSLGAKYTTPDSAYGKAEITGSLSHSWGQTDQDRSDVATDASRESRERYGTTTNLSQLYNLLTGYHLGTNRATFLMLPRPHTLQPTDRRTFVQGLRMIEGVQEFFLVIGRPDGLDGLCVEVFLETGHFPEQVTISDPPVEYDKSQENFNFPAHANSGAAIGETTKLESVPGSTHTIAADWVIDRTRGDLNHEGVSQIANRNNGQADGSLKAYNYKTISDVAVQISGTIQGAAFFGPGAVFDRDYRVFTRSAKPKSTSSGSKVTTPFLITSRGLCACLRSGEHCVEPVLGGRNLREALPGDSIVDERTVSIDATLVDTESRSQSRLPAMQEALQQVRSIMATSGRLPTRRPPGEVGFLESDYFKNQVRPYLPNGELGLSIGGVADPEVVNAFGPDTTPATILDATVPELIRMTGLPAEDVVKLRRGLLEKLAGVGGRSI